MRLGPLRRLVQVCRTACVTLSIVHCTRVQLSWLLWYSRFMAHPRRLWLRCLNCVAQQCATGTKVCIPKLHVDYVCANG